VEFYPLASCQKFVGEILLFLHLYNVTQVLLSEKATIQTPILSLDEGEFPCSPKFSQIILHREKHHFVSGDPDFYLFDFETVYRCPGNA
jgi:hypothetical protein